MSCSKALVATTLLAASFAACAQVHRCTDAAGKVSFSDTACPTTAKQAARVLGADATDRRWENEVYGRQRNMESIENAARLLREPTSDAVGDAGGGIIQSDPNERIRAQDERNMQRRMATMDADRARRAERDARADEARQAGSGAPTTITNCNASGCWDSAGNRYNRTGDGRNFWRADGKFCRANGNTFSCN
ncbi:DUF4124 domain-containing protein [Variovorax sp. AFSI2.2]|uniref:DUF4124 domain-containing protein n=1 Tax=Variovorax sp. AFSI2.2 TaxID=3384160 RepID=UPI003EB854C2